MAFDYKQYFGEILTAQDLVTRPEERTWRLAAPGRDAEHHDVVLYLGCNVLRTSHMIKTVTAIFDRLGAAIGLEEARGARALLLAGAPIQEPIVGMGPFAMNSPGEIRQAMLDFESGRMGRL